MTSNEAARALDQARKILNGPDSALAACEAAKASLEHVIAGGDADLEELSARRKGVMASSQSAGEINKPIDLIDSEVRATSRRTEIAAATASRLGEKIRMLRDAGEAHRRAAAYAAAKKDLEQFNELLSQRLVELARPARALIHDYANTEAAIMRVNADLPAGAASLPSIESFRRQVVPTDSQRELRRFMGFIDASTGRALGAQGSLNAEQRPDGKWTVAVGHSPHVYVTAELVNLVEVEATTHSVALWTEAPPIALSVPAAIAGGVPGWTIVPDQNAAIYPEQISDRLAQLEAASPLPLPAPQITCRLVPASQWDKARAEAA
jgi:hypothetical protein